MTQPRFHIMPHAFFRPLAATLVLVMLGFPGAAAADCYVHYKARLDSPYALHYGIVKVAGSCPSSPQRAVLSRISSAGWRVLNIVKVTSAPPTSSEIESAGSHYYR